MTPEDPAELVALVGRPAAPWVLVVDRAATVRRARTAARGAGLRVVTLAGDRMRTADGVHRQFAQALSFPDYFGHTWAGLEDCLIDLSWLPAPGYLVVVEDAAELLADEPDERVGLLGDLLSRVARSWAAPPAAGWPDRPPVPFHVVLLCGSADDRAAVGKRWAGAGVPLARA